MSKFVQLGGSTDPIGYCHYHKFTISKNQMKTKGCLEKNCGRFERYKEHPYWVNRDKKKAESKQFRAERRKRLKEEEKQLERNKLIHAINYCHSAPAKRDEETEHCSQCMFSDKCMSGIIDAMYIYFNKFEDLDFKEYCSPNTILVNKAIYERTMEKIGYLSTKNGEEV